MDNLAFFLLIISESDRRGITESPTPKIPTTNSLLVPNKHSNTQVVGSAVIAYIRSSTEIPSKDNPSFRVLAVRLHSTNREVRRGSSTFSTGH